MKLAMIEIGNVTHVTLHDCDLALVMPAFGTRDEDFLFGLIHQVANAGSNSAHPDVPGVKFMLAYVKSREPRDETEAMLLALIACESTCHHAVRKSPHSRRKPSGAGQRRAYVQQGGANNCGPSRNVSALPGWQRAEGHSAVCAGQQWQPDDCRER